MRYLEEYDILSHVFLPMSEPPDRDVWTEPRNAFIPFTTRAIRAGNPEVFFGDEVGLEGDPRPRQRWVIRGSNPAQGYYCDDARQNIVGAVSPK